MVLLVKLCQRTKAREREMLIPDKLATFQSPNDVVGRICVSGRFGSDFNGQKVDDGNGIDEEERKKMLNNRQHTTPTTCTF